VHRRNTAWITPTPTGIVRLLLSGNDSTPLWPMVVIPGMSCLFAAFLLVSRRWKCNIERDYPLLLALSFLTAPFGWIFDAVLLLPLFFEILLRIATMLRVRHLFTYDFSWISSDWHFGVSFYGVYLAPLDGMVRAVFNCCIYGYPEATNSFRDIH
jgi:hypothetical protein